MLDDLLGQARQRGAESADAVLIRSTDISVSRRLGALEELERAESEGIGLRVFFGRKQAVVSGSDLNKAALEELAERAVAMARQSPEDPYAGLAEAELLNGRDYALALEDDGEPTVDWLLAQCAEAEETALAVKGITNSEGASAYFSRSRVALATSNGFAREYGQTSTSLSLSVLAGKGTQMERDYDYAVVRHLKDFPQGEAIGHTAARRALERLGARRVRTCHVPVVFDPRVGRSLLSAFTGAISGGAVARGTSFLKNEMGRPVFAGGVTIIDDPYIPGGLGSRPFDGEGVVGPKLELVKNGVLQHWLLSCRSARQLGLPTNGRASRGLSSVPAPSTSNCYIAAGGISPAALIADIDEGLYVTETFGMGVNTVTGDYSQGAAGFWIEKGRKAWPVNELTIAGTLQEMFKSLTPADDLEFKYRTNTPTLRVERMTVAGS